MKRSTSAGRILKNDYGSLLMLIAIGVSWLLVVFAAVFGFLPGRRGQAIESGGDLPLMAGIAVAVTLLFGALALHRIAGIKRVIEAGTPCEGRVITVWFDRDRGRIDYEYQFNGQTHKSGNAIWKNRDTQAIAPGDPVTLIVDPSRPSRAFLASLYVTAPS